MSSVTSNARQKLFNTLQRVDIFKTFHSRGQIKFFVDFFKDKLVSYQKTSSHATDLDLFSSLYVSDVSLGIVLMF